MTMVASLRHRLLTLYRGDVVKNAGVLMLSNIVLSGFGFVFWFVAAHLEKKSDLGIASVIITAVSLLSTTGLLGLDSGVLRFLAEDASAQRQIQTVLVWTTLASAALGVLYVTFASHLSSHLTFLSHHWLTSCLLLLTYLEAFVFSTIAQNVFISRRRSWAVLVGNSVFSVLKVALIPVLVALGAMGLVASTAVALVVSVLVLVTMMRRQFSLSMVPRFHRGSLTNVRRYATTLFFTGVENNIVQALLPLIVLNRLGSEPAGAYYIALNISMVLGFVASSTFQSLIASVSHSTEMVSQRIHDALVHVTLLLVPLVAVFVIFAPLLLGLFGHVYADQSTTLLRLLALAAPFSALNYLFDAVAHIRTRNGLFFVMNTLNCLSVVVAAALFITRGLTGLGLAWLVGQLVTALCYLVVYRRELGQWLRPRD